MKAHHYTLPNGLRVVLLDTEAFPSLTTLLLVKAGSRYENTENNGIAHFFEHMAFKGSTKYPNAQILAETIEGMGGIFNAFTSDDYTGYYVKAPAEDVETVVDVIGDMVQHPNLDPKEIEKEKGVIIQEMNMYEDMPQQTVYEIFEKLLYKDHPLGYKIIGTKESVMKAQAKTFKNYIKDWYKPSNAVLILAGGLSAQNIKTFTFTDYEKIIVDRFGSWTDAQTPSVSPVVRNQQAHEEVLVYKKSEQAHFCYGYPTFPRTDSRRHAMAVLSAILGAGMSSRLFREVREKRGLCYSVRTYTEYYDDAGYIATYAGVEPIKAKVQEALQVIEDEHQKIQESPVSQEELVRAKELLKGRLILSLEDSFNVAWSFGSKFLFEGEMFDVDTYVKKIEQVTAKEVQSLARDYFTENTRNIALIGPFKDQGTIFPSGQSISV